MRDDPTLQWRRAHAVAVLVAVALLCSPLGLAREQRLAIQPGPSVMSEEERALQPDKARGVEHGVILVEETSRNEDLGQFMETVFHMRAKIFTNEGRDLANIEIPVVRGKSKLKKFWGRTILPDGTVHEMSKSELDRQLLASFRGEEVSVMKAALPGVVPGCVIDYGYVLKEVGLVFHDRVNLQRSWPILNFEFEWKPYSQLESAYRLSRSDQLDVRVTVDKRRLRVSGRNLPPVIEEPLMPPDHEVRASLTLYYVPYGVDLDRFWDETAKMMEKFVKSTAKNKRSVRNAIAAMGLSPDGDQRQALKKAYDWIGANITRTGLRTFEELQAASGGEEGSRDPVGQMLETKQGSGFGIQLMYIAVARAIGAEAHLVFAADRRVNFWHEGLKTWSQFDDTLVAARSAGVESFVVLDPGSGLPYGEVPWWYAGLKALLMDKKAARPITLPGTEAKNNVDECTVNISFTEDNKSMISSWVEKGRGQVGLGERRYLRSLDPDDRMKRVGWLCGAGPETDILTAEVVGLDDLSHGLELHCETEWFDVNIYDEIGEYRLPWGGPWLRKLPDLPQGQRHHPVIFDFPRVDVVNLEVTAPEGFLPDPPPGPQTIESSFGKYVLRVSRMVDRFSVQRTLALYPLLVPSDHYEELRTFISDVQRLDRTTLRFSRAEMAR